jgi:hypothetical protein
MPVVKSLIDSRLTNPLLLIALGFLAGGFAAINKFGKCQITALTSSYRTFAVGRPSYHAKIIIHRLICDRHTHAVVLFARISLFLASWLIGNLDSRACLFDGTWSRVRVCQRRGGLRYFSNLDEGLLSHLGSHFQSM